MQQPMHRLILGFVLVSLPLAAALGFAQSGSTAPARSGLELGAINRRADPCVDFYQFACGAWTASNPIPADRSRWGRFDELQEKNNNILRRILETAAAGGDPASRKIGDYYASCMDEPAVDRKGIAPLETELRAIAARTSVNGLPDLLGGLHPKGINAFFRFRSEADAKNAKMVIAGVGQGGLGLPDRDYYFRDDARSVEIRTKYTEHIANTAVLVGLPKDQASAEAAAVTKLETALAKGALDVVSRRDPNKVY